MTEFQLGDRAVLTPVISLVGEVFRVWLEWCWCLLSDTHSQEQRIWCWVSPCIVPVNRGSMPWREHPNPALFGDQHGFLCV